MPLSVIGAGLGRTGTMSLKLALERLGFGPCHHMVEVFADPPSAAVWADAGEGKPVDWEALLTGFHSAVDYPAAAFYRELAEAYPEAKVILTLRDPEAWWRSTQATIFARDVPDPPTNPWERMVLGMTRRTLGGETHDHDHLIAPFNAHTAEVRKVIPPERLLVYEVAEGWEPLCAFLGVAVPSEAMLHTNTTGEFQARIREGFRPGVTPMQAGGH